MLVATGPVKRDGKILPHGTPVPEAVAWPAHVLKIHLDSGWVRDMDQAEVDVLAKANAAKLAKQDAAYAVRLVEEAEAVFAASERSLVAASAALEVAKDSVKEAKAGLDSANAYAAGATKAKEPASTEPVSELSGLDSAELIEMAEGLGLSVSKRWGEPRLRKEIEDALNS